MEANCSARKIIALTTDFGLQDPYVAEMKAVILGLCYDAIIVDITHSIEKFNIRMGAYMLASTEPYFPKGTIHVAVIDPGVGTARRSLLVQTQDASFIGPDNGVLMLAAEKQGIMEIREITNPEFMLPHVSNTFHGRDVFASVAAHLANGVSTSEFGPEIHDAIKPDFIKVIFRKNSLIGEVLHVDSFGNIITNVTDQDLNHLRIGNSLRTEVADCKMNLKIGRTYAESKRGEALILVGSQGYLEIAINQGNAAEKFDAKQGDKVLLSAELPSPSI